MGGMDPSADLPDAIVRIAGLTKRYGRKVRHLSVDQPILESVFLSLTGRELCDRAAGRRERTYAFGRRGGEHTR
jgi:ABC-2 type transport system ATP-binding protein